MAEKQAFQLTENEMEQFGLWLSLDLTERAGVRGRRQERPMEGYFCTRPNGKVPGAELRGSDFSLRVVLLIHGWRSTGMSIRAAAEKVAEDYRSFLEMRLGSKTEIDETVRSAYYYPLREKLAIDQQLEFWFWNFQHWCGWIGRIDRRLIESVILDYSQSGKSDSEALFRALISEVRSATRSVRVHRILG